MDSMDEATYRKVDATSYSVHLKPLVTGTPAHSLHLQTHGSTDTPSRAYLRAVHCLALEPEAFPEQFAIATMRRDTRTAAYRDFLVENAGRSIITATEYSRAYKIAGVVRGHPMVRDLLELARTRPEVFAYPEIGILTDHPEAGASKGRIDLLVLDRGNRRAWVIDLKTWRETPPERIGSDIVRGAWDVQLAWYHGLARLSGLIPVDYDVQRVSLIASEGGPDSPITVGWYVHSEAMCMVGDIRLADAIDTLAHCRRSGIWPGEHTTTEVDPP